MAATVTNEPKNTATLINQELGSLSVKWDDATYTWDQASGTWNNPYAISNQAKNTATPTNQVKN